MPKTDPLISIIIPVYNAGKYLSETLASALGQNWANKEIIIIDDGSTDNSLAIAQQYTDKHVKIFSQANKGASAARNLGLQHAKGKYIQFLDADDLLSEDKISGQVQLLEKEPGKIAVCSIVKFKNGTHHNHLKPSHRDEPFIYSTDDVVDFLIDLYGGYKKRGSMIGIHSWLIPADLISKSGIWNEELTVDDDGEFFCRIVLNSKGIIKSNGLCYYRMFYAHKENLSARADKNSLRSMINSFNLKKQYLLARTNADAAHFALYKQTLNLAIRTYLIYPDLYFEVKKQLKAYPAYNYKPIIRGKFLNIISNIFGWRVARFLQYQYSKV